MRGCGLPGGVDPGPLIGADVQVGEVQPGAARAQVPQQGRLPIMHLHCQEVHLRRTGSVASELLLIGHWVPAHKHQQTDTDWLSGVVVLALW